MEPTERSRIPPVGPYPRARRGHPEEPLRVSGSTPTGWLVAAWALAVLGCLALALVVLVVVTAPRP